MLERMFSDFLFVLVIFAPSMNHVASRIIMIHHILDHPALLDA
jgi:hypothetical protein